MTKELALIFQFAKAPKALQDAARAVRQYELEYKKLTDQHERISTDRQASEVNFRKALAEFQRLLNEWEPDDSDADTGGSGGGRP